MCNGNCNQGRNCNCVFANVADPKCICQGNWRLIIQKSEHLFDKHFKDASSDTYTFYGVVFASDDFYYGMYKHSDKTCRLLSCVSDIEGHGFTLIEDDYENHC
jgi:hypothetical protein